MLRALNRWMTSYRYRVERSGLPEFEIIVYAGSSLQASRRAAHIGKRLHILLVGPV